MEAKEMRFPSSAGFKSWSLFFTSESTSHPAKANLYLLYYLIKKYTEKGEVVSDPMAGTGSTGIIASDLGRHSVLVDLEEKFYRMMVGWHPCDGWQCFDCQKREEKREKLGAEINQLRHILKFSEEPLFFDEWADLSQLFYTKHHHKLRYAERDIEKYPWDDPEPGIEHDVPGNRDLLEKYGGKKGEIKVLQGDARKLTDLLGVSADSIVTSPPYSEKERWQADEGEKGFHSYDENEVRNRCKRDYEFPENPDNIGNLSHGEIDVVVTSPPYSESLSTTDDEKRRLERVEGEHPDCGYLRNKRQKTASHRMGDGYSENPENIGNLPHGNPDAIIASPPYEGVEPFKDREFQRTRYPRSDRPCKGKHGTYLGPKVGVASLENKDNIGNLKSEDGEYEELEKNVAAIVSSPPYSESPRAGNKDSDRFFAVAEERHRRKFTGKSRRMMKKMHYSDDPDGLGNLKHGDIDTIVTSPPYSESLTKKRKGYTVVPNLEKTRQMGEETKDENIANLSHGKVDTVITSPPYSEGLGHGRGRAEQLQKEKQLHLHGAESYSESPGNIGEIRTHGEIDVVVTSPPYESTHSPESRGKDPVEIDSIKEIKPGCIHWGEGHSDNEENIGNQKGETYLSAMLRVYQEMFKVLKPGGKVILIIKPFIRNKKVVDLPLHTWLLLKKCGFRLAEVLKFRLPYVSFWRVLYRKKYPEVENINHEYILVCQK